MGRTRQPFDACYTVDTNGCWLWARPLSPSGYGRYAKMHAHRWSYIESIGLIPEGYVIDHLCRVRSCVNPAHLEAVTIRENTARGEHPSGAALRGVCSNGHIFSGNNVRERKHRPGIFECVQCNRARSKRYRENRRRV